MIYYILAKSQRSVLDYKQKVSSEDIVIHVTSPDVVSTDSSYGTIVVLDDFEECWNWVGIDEAIWRMKDSWTSKGWHKDLMVEDSSDVEFINLEYGIQDEE